MSEAKRISPDEISRYLGDGLLLARLRTTGGDWTITSGHGGHRVEISGKPATTHRFLWDAVEALLGERAGEPCPALQMMELRQAAELAMEACRLNLIHAGRKDEQALYHAFKRLGKALGKDV